MEARPTHTVPERHARENAESAKSIYPPFKESGGQVDVPFHDFHTLEEAPAIIGAFIERYNHGWILERHGYKTPTQARQELTRLAA